MHRPATLPPSSFLNKNLYSNVRTFNKFCLISSSGNPSSLFWWCTDVCDTSTYFQQQICSTARFLGKRMFMAVFYNSTLIILLQVFNFAPLSLFIISNFADWMLQPAHNKSTCSVDKKHKSLVFHKSFFHFPDIYFLNSVCLFESIL